MPSGCGPRPLPVLDGGSARMIHERRIRAGVRSMAEQGSHGSGGVRGATKAEPSRPSVPPRRSAGWASPRSGGLGLRAQIVLSLALLMAVVLGMLALGTHVLVPLAVRRAVAPARQAMAHALASRPGAAARRSGGGLRRGTDAGRRRSTGGGVSRSGASSRPGRPPSAEAFGATSQLRGPRETDGIRTVVREPSPDRVGCGRCAWRRRRQARWGQSRRSSGVPASSAIAVVVFGYIR